ncbi:hypothetical protein DCO58_01585 [Helicobacter saguini]|uniref:Uncharacterized protein n=1 Tax=Helicobacter saguini TaxID=1548018 RepID=A0A099BB18_9HELI|nr:hypothetical protein [Helicobacter saguini]MWV62926.1 hypothetical protein [Helicobacter saguini]MWV66404.1 hypothetical protein [Helicobacter saguini]MWV68756.1 hypothetical protein [Helicobacter saguini]MWV71691.1 hypothetical protein [Helicobacter saguini]TLD91875.1 hypothetical protein LS64_011165 [Helicobacter saguini]
MKKLVLISLLLLNSLFLQARGITNEEISAYFNEFVSEYPALKWSGFFSIESNTRSPVNALNNDISTDISGVSNIVTNDVLSGSQNGFKNVNLNNLKGNFKNTESSEYKSLQKSGLHISNCVDNECEISYNDYTDYKSGFAPLPECYSPQKLVVLDGTHAKVGDTSLKIIDDKLQVYGTLTFTCDDSVVMQNLERVGVERDLLEVSTYEISLRDVSLSAHFNYPINLNCITRARFSEKQLCVEPFLSDSYSFNQFFIFLAARAPDSFRHPNSIYINYRKMQSEISMCEHSKYRIDCIYAALGKFDSKIKDNLIINKSPHIAVHYTLMK